MAAELSLYVDIVNKKLVTSLYNEAPVQLPPFYQYEKYAMRIYLVRPTGAAIGAKFEITAVANYTLRVGIGPRLGAEARIAAQDTWVPNAASGYLAAEFDLNTSNVNALFTGPPAIDEITGRYFEIVLSDSAVPRVVYQAAVTIVATVIDISGAVALPVPAPNYPTREEMLATCVKWINDQPGDQGKTITLPKSAGGAAGAIIYTGDDGEFKADKGS